MIRSLLKMGKTALVLVDTVVLLLFSVSPALPMDCIDSNVLQSIKPAGVNQPSDLAIGPQGNIYLVDGVNNRIVVVNVEGSLLFTFGKSGDNQGEFNYPMGIDISKDGRVFIADTGNHRIQVFTMEGIFLNMFPVKTSPGEKPADPVDVLALGRKNYLYISDNDNHKIKVHTQDGAFAFGNLGKN